MNAHRTRFSSTLLTLIVVIGLGSGLSACTGGAAVHQEAPAPATKIPQVSARNGMVASAHPLASQAGLMILKAGGNAVDAAVATAFANSVVEPNANGLGGEGMMVIWLADQRKAVAIDYRAMAPLADKTGQRWPSSGPLSVAVPGTVAGLCMALEKYGTKSLQEVMAPAIKLAEDGFVISPTLSQVIADGFAAISKDPPLAKMLAPEGLPLEAGEVLKNPDLAVSLRKIAAGGRDVFYKGELADAIATAMAANGGLIGRADLAAYQAIERAPVRGSYRGFEIVSAPPPVSGLTVIESLHILENFDLAKNAPLSKTNVHLMAEALKRAFADNAAHIGDPAFTKVPVAGLLSKGYAKSLAQGIPLDTASREVKAGDPSKEHPSTTHMSVADRMGNMVALTQTLSGFWGAHVVPQGTGIILNNEMQNWSSAGPNTYAPGKRMRTTIAPTILLKDGQVYASLGSPGAARIISTMVILITNLIDHGMTMQQAIESPRFYTRDTDKSLHVEARIPAQTIEALKAMGYATSVKGEYDLFFGGAQGIVVDRKRRILTGGADPRRDGAVLGY
jgi:gamma-glutamyltranspeptidase/glutathione hydrolase